MQPETRPTAKQLGDRAAFRVIMGKATKKSVVAFALGLPDDQVDGANDTFSRQGPRLWMFWCAGMDARAKAGSYVPAWYAKARA